MQERLPPLAQDRLAAGLYRWQDRVTTLLASGGGLEDDVRLTVANSAGQRLARTLAQTLPRAADQQGFDAAWFLSARLAGEG